ncbi:MAG: carbonic anhydrase [Micrococcales bacterium]|nr:carbonic anhydrase [Micrococcales bacterium]
MTDRLATVPADAWAELAEGNARFRTGSPEHPRQDGTRRAGVASGQAPHAAVLGCSDSRASAELLFDQGLGDLFVVRNAGQVLSPDALGSIEYAVAVLGVPLVVVLAHDACGAVASAVAAEGADAPALPVHIAELIEPIRVAVRAVPAADRADAVAAGARHLQDTVGALLRDSEIVADGVAAGTLAVVGAVYHLADGAVEPRIAVGVSTA